MGTVTDSCAYGLNSRIVLMYISNRKARSCFAVAIGLGLSATPHTYTTRQVIRLSSFCTHNVPHSRGITQVQLLERVCKVTCRDDWLGERAVYYTQSPSAPKGVLATVGDVQKAVLILVVLVHV